MQLQDRFYKSTEVSDILGISLRTLYRYMETGKIQSIHLPSGRHRFTKDQIEAFLFASKYMTLDEDIQKPAEQNVAPEKIVQPEIRPIVESSEKDIDDELEQLLKSLEQEDTKSVPNFNSTNVQNDTPRDVVTTSPLPSIEEEKEDDLDTFLRSLENEEMNQKPQSSFTSILNDGYGLPIQPIVNENEVKYYYCPFNDLKSIAKMIKKIGDEHNKMYAFTMNAGLSLFFPLDLFSMIHFYVNVVDLPYFEKELELKPSTKTEANIGILLTKGDAHSSIKEVSGFKVVRKEKMIENLKSNGLMQLASEAELRL